MEGGFYAEYVVAKQDNVAKLPEGLSAEQAGALGADGITALRGLEDALNLRRGQKLIIFGASGGIGHLAVQLAKRLGAEVFAVASGEDGVALVRRLGADQAVDGKHGAVVDALHRFAPQGLDAALVLANGKGLDAALAQPEEGRQARLPQRRRAGAPGARRASRVHGLRRRAEPRGLRPPERAHRPGPLPRRGVHAFHRAAARSELLSDRLVRATRDDHVHKPKLFGRKRFDASLCVGAFRRQLPVPWRWPGSPRGSRRSAGRCRKASRSESGPRPASRERLAARRRRRRE